MLHRGITVLGMKPRMDPTQESIGCDHLGLYIPNTLFTHTHTHTDGPHIYLSEEKVTGSKVTILDMRMLVAKFRALLHH